MNGDERERIYCRECRRETNHSRLWGDDRSGSIDDWYHWATDYRVLECMGCDALTFETRASNSEDMDEDGPIITVEQYPPRVPDLEFLDSDRTSYLPWKVRTMYEEVIQALTAGSVTLAAIGIRSIVEAVCSQKGVAKGTLEKRIDHLATEGIVSTEQAEFLHLLREYGNVAAHEIEPPSRGDTAALLDIVQQILRTTYRVPWAAKKHRPKKEQPSKQSPRIQPVNPFT